MNLVRRTSRLAALVVTAALACTTLALAPAAATTPSKTKETDLSGVTLHVGDQADNHLRLVLEASGEDKKLPYDIEWSTFQNGPLLIAAATGGSVDIGKLSETPLVFAQAAGSPVKVVYAGQPIDPTTSSLAIAVKKDSTIKKIADLKGKRVAYVPGTVLQYLLTNALASAGLTLDDVQLATFQPGVDLLASGDADAIVTGDPTLSLAVTAGTQRILATGAKFTPGFYYLTASDSALGNTKTSAAIGDLLQRLTKAEVWWNAHPAVAAKLVAEQSKLQPEAATAVVERAPVAYGPITPAIIAAHQKEADFFTKLGTIKTKLVAKSVFDTRYGTSTTSSASEKS